MSYTTMPWGKYRGVPLDEIEDDSYLAWVAYKAEAASPFLKSEVEAELERRAAARRSQQKDGREDAADDVRGRIKSWFAELARDYHPDRTGDNGKVMAALNDAYDRLRKAFGF
jgi:hypothetical protein